MTNDSTNAGRRKFLVGSTSAAGVAGVAGAAIPFIGSWNPSAKAKARQSRRLALADAGSPPAASSPIASKDDGTGTAARAAADADAAAAAGASQGAGIQTPRGLPAKGCSQAGFTRGLSAKPTGKRGG